MSNIERTHQGVDANVPNAARVYDYFIGGDNYHTADRTQAEQMQAIAPQIHATAAAHREVALRGTRAAAEAGVRQFIDIGAGMPISPAVHEIAQAIHPDARVVSIDNDPVVHAHSMASMAGLPSVTPMFADLRRPDELIDRLRADELVDFAEPAAIVLAGVVNFVMDEEHPHDIVARLRDELAPGSYLLLTHATDDTHPAVQELAEYSRGTPAQFAYRSPAAVRAFFEGFDVLAPGVVPVETWLDPEASAGPVVFLVGLGRKPV
ncbi:MAG: SAM-dependent methyltransferase [Mycobacteriaceae bacterium]|nr:SAM-dependent methyltransferase [Mycobacteriaceae bacterium]